MARTPDFYAQLDVGRDASPEEIKKGYKRMAIKFHPDKHSAAGDKERAMAEEKFKEIAEAYTTLSDPDKKQLYDRHVSLGRGDVAGPGFDVAGPEFDVAGIDPMDLFAQVFAQMRDPNGVNGDSASKKEQRAASEAFQHAGRDRAPPAGLRFAYDGAAYHEGAVLHGLAAPYEGLFRLSTREVNGKPAYRHALRRDRWIAFNGSGWMAQNDRALGTKSGVLLLKDTRCATPDVSPLSWLCSPGWHEQPGLRVVAMSAEEADRWELQSNPWGEMAALNEALEIMNLALAADPAARVARDPRASTTDRLAALDHMQQQRQRRAQQAVIVGPAAVASNGRNPFDARDRSGRSDSGRGSRGGVHSGHGNGGRGNGGRVRLALGGGALYVGCVGGASGNKPHGVGELLLKDGSVHAGHFDGGGAHGGGVYFDCQGSVHSGSWVCNHRFGLFEAIDPAGALWEDLYDQSGTRTQHKRRGRAPGSAADVCKLCGVKFHGTHNYSCRRHAAEFDGLTWQCCGAASVEEPGCHVEPAHEA